MEKRIAPSFRNQCINQRGGLLIARKVIKTSSKTPYNERQPIPYFEIDVFLLFHSPNRWPIKVFFPSKFIASIMRRRLKIKKPVEPSKTQ